MPADLHIVLDVTDTAKLDALRGEERARPTRNAFARALLREALDREHPRYDPKRKSGPGTKKAARGGAG